MANWLLGIAGAVVLGFLIVWLGFPFGTTAFIGLLLAGLGGLKLLKVVQFPINDQMSMIAIVVGLVLAFSAGAFGTIFSGIAQGSLTAGAMTQGAAGMCSVPVEQQGTSSTLTYKFWDKAPDTKLAVTSGKVLLMKDGSAISGPGDASSATAVNVGDLVDIYPSVNNATYYGVPKKGVCIKGQQQTEELDLYTQQAESSMTFTAVDTNRAALTSGDGSEEDYEITLGASATDSFTSKLKNNAASKVFDFCAIATRTLNDIKNVEPTSGGLTKVAVPQFLKTTSIYLNETTGAVTNYTGGYDTVWKAPSTIRLRQWEYMENSWKIEAGTTDPSEDNSAAGYLSKDVAIIQTLDCAWATDGSNVPQYDFYAHNATENNVGIIEPVISPIGKTSGFMIEGA